jgi:L-seryl-tRNA(Ser) seleniumtransferase
MKRREIIKNFSVLPLLGFLPAKALKAENPKHSPKRNIFKELGIRTFINAAGTYTIMSGCIMADEVLETLRSSAGEFAMIDEVQDRVGERIARMCHAEAAMVTAGCWSAMVLGMAGILTGMDEKKAARLPLLEGMKSEVLVQKAHNHGYIHALTNTGVRIVEVETIEDVEKALNEKTALLWFLNYAGPDGKISDQEWVTLGKKNHIPTMIDMAADATPVENLWKFNDMGFDLVCISGGKGMRGPQSAGILMGKKDLIAAARLNAPPRGGNIGRGMKVNKEEILGMYVALDHFINMDHQKLWKSWEDRINYIEKAVNKIKGIKTRVSVPPVANRTPTLTILWDNNQVKISRDAFQERLRQGSPSIEVFGGKENSIVITAWNLQPEQEKIVARRIAEEFSRVII